MQPLASASAENPERNAGSETAVRSGNKRLLCDDFLDLHVSFARLLDL